MTQPGGASPHGPALICNTGSYFMANRPQSDTFNQKRQTASQHPKHQSIQAKGGEMQFVFVMDATAMQRESGWERAHIFVNAWHISVDKTSHVTTMKMAQLMVYFCFLSIFLHQLDWRNINDLLPTNYRPIQPQFTGAEQPIVDQLDLNAIGWVIKQKQNKENEIYIYKPHKEIPVPLEMRLFFFF